MKYTAQQIKFELQKDNPALLEKIRPSGVFALIHFNYKIGKCETPLP